MLDQLAEYEGLAIQVGLALLAVLATLIVLTAITRSVQQWVRSGAREITFKETRHLGDRSFLHVVEFRDRTYLLAESQSGVQLVDRLEAGSTAAVLPSEVGPPSLRPRADAAGRSGLPPSSSGQTDSAVGRTLHRSRDLSAPARMSRAPEGAPGR